MERTIRLFNILTGKELTEREGWLLMVCLKLVRSMTYKQKQDTYVDMVGYSALLGECSLFDKPKPGQVVLNK